MFYGLNEDMYRFFWEIAFHNDASFFEPNRERYRENVQKPLLELAAELAPTVRTLDERLNTRPSTCVSRIRRDTRYTKDKSPYRDHMWLNWRLPDTFLSECFVLYAEFERESYGYGMGMYAPVPPLMKQMRERILARPEHFLSLVREPKFAERFTLQGQPYKKMRYTEVPEEALAYVNLRSMSFCFSSDQLGNTLKPELLDELRGAFETMKPVYRFLMGLE